MLDVVKRFFRLQFLFVIIAVIAGIYYTEIIQLLKKSALHLLIDNTENGDSVALKFKTAPPDEKVKLFTKGELATFNGVNDAPLYLALLGSVYDVSKGAKHYGPSCAYNFFVGRDASVSFITGEFENFDENNADDVIAQLKSTDLLSLANWKSFYDKEYTYKGKLIGRYYNEAGEPTVYHYKYLALLEQAQESKAAQEKLRTTYPDCNVQWSVETGTRVWCTNTSGGKDRAWSGYPRKLFEVGSESFRCACIRAEELDTKKVMIKQYDNCESLAQECFYNVEE